MLIQLIFPTQKQGYYDHWTSTAQAPDSFVIVFNLLNGTQPLKE